jgi:RNA polymerase sigma-70 factor (ECF subfamily)
MSKRKTKISEQDLLELLKTKTEKGFSVLYDNYSAALFGVVNRIVRSEEIAADITQDAFVKIWKNLENYNASKGTIFTWMINVARNTAIDKIRSQEYLQTRQNLEIESYTGVIDTENNTSLNIDAIGLKNLVEKLRPEYKQLIDLVYYKGYTQSEIADEFDIPLGTVKTRIKSAITSLRSYMSEIIIVFLTLFLK